MSVAIAGALVMDDVGGFAPRTVTITEDGRFGPAATPDQVIDAAGMWLIPGVYDCHCHITWNDFHGGTSARATEAALLATLRAGVTSLRDAGGAAATLRGGVGPRLQVAVDMIGAAQAGTPDTMRGHVEAALAKGAQWIKLVATAGVATPADSVLDSHFSEAEIRTAVDTAQAGGARVMMHSWGGDSIDWAIEHGVTSIEHGIYLTSAQMSAAAAAGMTLVPTLTIYREVRDMVLAGELDGVDPGRIRDVVATHERIIPLARDLGLPLCVGSDFGMAAQHGRNLVEIGALIRAGLPPSAALLAATVNGARLLNDADGGRIAPGFWADAVLLRADPTDPRTFDDPGTVAAVIQAGQVVSRRSRSAGGLDQ